MNVDTLNSIKSSTIYEIFSILNPKQNPQINSISIQEKFPLQIQLLSKNHPRKFSKKLFLIQKNFLTYSLHIYDLIQAFLLLKIQTMFTLGWFFSWKIYSNSIEEKILKINIVKSFSCSWIGISVEIQVFYHEIVFHSENIFWFNLKRKFN